MNKMSYTWNKKDQKDFDYATGIIAFIIGLTAVITILSKPSIQVIGGRLYINQGVIIPALIFGTMIWSVSEVFTKATKKAYDIIIKVIIAFPIGLAIGGFIGYESNFGQLVLSPAYNGNPYALFFLVCILIYEIVLIMANVYFHHCTPLTILRRRR